MKDPLISSGAAIGSVAGGAAGVEAEYADLRRLGEYFEALGRDIGDAAQDDSLAAFDADLVASSILSPATAAAAEHAILAATVGPEGLAPQALLLHVRGQACQGALALYRGADEARAAACEAAGRALGWTLTATPSGVLTLAGLAVVGQKTGRWDLLGAALPGVVDRIRMSPVPRAGLFVLSKASGSPAQGPANDLYEGIYGTRRAGESAAAQTEVEQSVPRSVRDLTRGIERASGESARFTVQELRAPDGSRRFVVQLPGTDDGDWDSVRDHTSNLQLLEGGRTAYGDAIGQGLARAGAGADDAVLLVGHSQGGMQAMALADDPDFGYDVRGVVTVGAPVHGVRLADDVSVLTLENSADPVPQLDSGANPAGPNQVNVAGTIDVGKGIANHSLTHSYGPLSEAVDNSDDPSVRRVVERLEREGFLTADSGVQSTTSTFSARER